MTALRPTRPQPGRKTLQIFPPNHPQKRLPALSPLRDAHMGEVRCSPGLHRHRHVGHQTPIGAPEVIGRVGVVVAAQAAEELAQLLGDRHRHLTGRAEADADGVLGEPHGVLSLVDGQLVGDFSWDGGWDPVDLKEREAGKTQRLNELASNFGEK